MLSRLTFAKAIVLGAMLHASAAQAGWYLSPAVRWASVSHRPEASELTPNYYGYGGLLATGYSAKQIFDLGFYGAYTPASYKRAAPGSGDVELTNFGAEVALRLGESVYIGFRGGRGAYNLLKQTQADELLGRWVGPAGELALGGVTKLTKSSFLQVNLEFMHGVYKGKDEDLGRRRFDGVAVSLAYVYNHYKSYLIDNTIFGDFLNSLMF